MLWTPSASTPANGPSPTQTVKMIARTSASIDRMRLKKVRVTP